MLNSRYRSVAASSSSSFLCSSHGLLAEGKRSVGQKFQFWREGGLLPRFASLRNSGSLDLGNVFSTKISCLILRTIAGNLRVKVVSSSREGRINPLLSPSLFFERRKYGKVRRIVINAKEGRSLRNREKSPSLSREEGKLLCAKSFGYS